MSYRYDPNRRERVGRWFEAILLGIGIFLILLDFIATPNGTAFVGLLVLFLWTFINGQRNGLRLQELERKYVQTLREEGEMRIDRKRVIRITLLASLPLYLCMAFPIFLMPVGGMIALASFFPLFGVVGIRFHFFYERWRALEVKPQSLYWWMQVGICLCMIAVSYAIFFLVFGGELPR